MVGGGARSAFWRQVFADVFEVSVLKTGIDQQAASLGAAALAFVGTGLWKDFGRIVDLHTVEHRATPAPEAKAVYDAARDAYKFAAHQQTLMADRLSLLRVESARVKTFS